MARIVTTQKVVKDGFKLYNIYTDDTVSVNEFFEDDIVENLAFADDNTKVVVNGRITDVKLYNKRIPTKKYVDDDSCVENDCSVQNVALDFSEKNFSQLRDINPREILEFNPTKEVKRVNVKATKKVNLSVTLSDDSTSSIELKEGMKLFNVTIQSRGSEVSGDYVLKCFFFEVKEKVYTPDVVGMYLIDKDNDMVRVYFEDIKVCGNDGMVVEEGASLNAVMQEFVANGSEGGIVLPASTFTESLVMNNNINMLGNKSGVIANKGSRCTDEYLIDESYITNTISCEKGASVVITGVTFTEKSTINVNNANDITFKNCRFLGIDPTKTQELLIYGNPGVEEPVLVQIENCYFGSNGKNELGSVYNLINLHSKLASGSYIRNCYFAKEVCTHNVINMYNVEENGEIEISNNYFEYAANGIRLSVNGETKCTFNIFNNVYAETDTAYPDYAGLLLIQPTGKATTSFANMTVNLDNNVCLADKNSQLFYIYCGANDTQIDETNCPKIYVNGKYQELVF